MNLASRTALVSVGQGLVKLGQLAFALVLVRLLDEQGWRTMALLLSIYLAAINLGCFHLQQGVFYFFGRLPPSERRRVALHTSLLLGITGTIAAAVVAALEPGLRGGEYEVHGLLAPLALVVWLEMPSWGGAQLLLAAERPGASTAFAASMAALQLAAACVPIALGWGLAGAVWGLAGYAAVRLVVYVFALRAVLPPGPLAPVRARLVEQAAYTLPLGLAMGTALLNRYLDKWIVAWLDPAHFGSYTLAAYEVPFVSILPYALGAVLATRMVHAFTKGDLARVRAYWQAGTSRMALVVVPVTAGLVVCAPELARVLFTAAYADAALPFAIYTAILLHRVAEYGVVLRAAGDTRSLWAASGVLLAANVALCLPLVLVFGMTGAATASLLANGIAWLFVLRRIARATGTNFAGVFPWRAYGLVLGVSAAAALVTAGAATAMPEAAPIRLAAKALVYAALAWGGLRLVGAARSLPPIPADDASFAASGPSPVSPTPAAP